MKNNSREDLKDNRRSYFYYGLGAGAFFTLAAQMTYGHVLPISALLVAFYLVGRGAGVKRLAFLSLGLLIPAALYLIFEYFISAGTSFYFVRALSITDAVGSGLDKARPYPLAQVANFVIMAVMGGMLFLPLLIYVSRGAIRSVVAGFRNRRRLSDAAGEAPAESRVRQFIIVATFLMLLMLLSQTTVRLEVERTWHWFFIPVWSLMGIFILSPRVVIQRLFPSDGAIRTLRWAPLVLCFAQLLITVVLAMSIQDYY